MDYPLVIGILVVLVVGFFAFQWMTKRPRSHMKVPAPAPVPAASAASEIATQAKEEKFPVIAGQTTAEALAKEPDQRREPSSSQVPALYTGEAPAQFEQHLRHPEQLFHQPPSGPSAHSQSDVASGRASDAVLAGGQGFSPEMAQNGGAFLGNSVFAYDGMEPTGFTAF
jgi:hypothetical protein